MVSLKKHCQIVWQSEAPYFGVLLGLEEWLRFRQDYTEAIDFLID